jgi:peptidoglycan/xylan/chitin deacetylase (PgdA/CDA1 family)
MNSHTPLSILIYHRVLAKPDWLFPEQMHAHRFRQHLALLSRWFNVLPLADALQQLRLGSLPPRAVAITFDDGYADNAEVALPLLQQFGMSATFFIASGFLDGGQMWNDAVIDMVRHAVTDSLNLSRCGFGRIDIRTPEMRRAAIDTLLRALKHLPPAERLSRVKSMTRHFTPTMLSTDQLLALHRGGMDIGAHTISHPILNAIDAAEARLEIAGGRRQLERIIQAPVRLFAYPNGKIGQDFDLRHVELVKSMGYEGAVTTAWGTAQADGDLFQLPRFTPRDRSSSSFLLRMVHNRFRRAV